ncbi:MAG: hypothetical protein LUG62_00690 [Clostridiales bacterium]|nr:hypothetical protein [Clostridiales bacterium]
MKKIRNVCLTVFLCLFCGASVWADTAPDGAKADYATDYYMIVQSPDGGIDIYDTPDFDGQKLNDDPIPNGMALHIEGEVEDGDRTWGYTEYHGMHGYVPLDDCEPVTRSRAIESEIETRGSEPADYDVEADSPEGSVALYNGPGEKFGEVSDAEEIPNGETIHITETVEGDQGITWGKTEKDDKEGWVNLEETINPDAVETESGEAVQNGQDESTDRAGEESTGLVSMETEETESSGSGEESAAGESAGTDTAVTPTSEPAESAVVTQAPTQTPTVTPAPSATVTLVPDETEETGGVSVAAGGVGQTGEEDDSESESSETETDDENPEDTTLLARAEESEDEDSGDETEKTRLTATPRPTQTSAADSEDSGDSETGLEVSGENEENEDSSGENEADAEATEENATDAEATEEDASDLEATGENATDAEATGEDAAGSEESKEEETAASSAVSPFV